MGGIGATNFALVSSKWTKCTCTFTASTSGTLYFWLLGAGDAYLSELRLEDGTTATTYGSTIGTIITQSSSEVMTAFNNISSYFQVSADGAKFGNIASGDYTIMSSNGLQQHIGDTNYDYLYVAYGQISNVYVGNSTSSTVSIYVPYDTTLKTMLRGRKPKVCVILNKDEMYTLPPGYAYVMGGDSNVVLLTSWDTNGFNVNCALVKTIVNMSSPLKEIVVYGGVNKISFLVLA